MRLTSAQHSLHLKAVRLARTHKNAERRIVAVIQQIDTCKLFKPLGYPSLFKYAVECLQLSEALAFSMISVARKALEIGELNVAIHYGTLSVAKASRIVSAITEANAEELIQFAKTHSTREVDEKVATIRPKAAAPDRAIPLAEDLVKLEMSVSKEVEAKFRRVLSLLASKKGRHVGFEEALDIISSEYIEHHDPVVRAERAYARQERVQAEQPKEEPATESSASAPKVNDKHLKSGGNQGPELCARRVRRPLTAAEKHAVFRRDGGRCTHVDESGKRCDSDRWLQVHHIVLVSHGGTNDPENLTTLCAYHHDLVHQVSWLRSPVVEYQVRR